MERIRREVQHVERPYDVVRERIVHVPVERIRHVPVDVPVERLVEKVVEVPYEVLDIPFTVFFPP